MATSEPWRSPRPAPQMRDVQTKFGNRGGFGLWLRNWWPVLLWASLIFFASTDTFSSEHTGGVLASIWHWLNPQVTNDTLAIANHLIRKTAHFAEYFVFFLLLYRGIRGTRTGWQWSWALPAWFIAAAYSALDEIHQSFVASRTASAWDSLLDSVGAAAALLVVFLYFHLRQGRTRNHPKVS